MESVLENTGNVAVTELNNQPKAKNRYFDPKTPEQPDQVMGVETTAILKLGRAATDLGVLPPKVNLGLCALPNAVRLVPLVEQMQSGEKLSPEDIRPYRKPIKKLSLGLSFADKTAVAAGAIAIGVPARRALNRKIESEFPNRANEAIVKAREALAIVEQDVDFIASFENPKAQFEKEVEKITHQVTASIYEARASRVNNGSLDRNKELYTPKGIEGLFVKVFRKITSFFGLFGRRKKPIINHEITAYDAGEGLEKTLKNLASKPVEYIRDLPLFSRFVLDKIPKEIKLTKDQLALAAPEILNFIFSISPDSQQISDLMTSVRRNPHEFRFIADHKKYYKHYSLERIRRASHTLLPAIRDVLPNTGEKVHDIYDQAQKLLTPKQEVEKAEQPTDQTVSKKPKHLGTRFKNLFKKQQINKVNQTI